MRGNCYAASEALYHILGGKRSGWEPHVMRINDGTETHWFLKHRAYHTILDPSRRQFKRRNSFWGDRWTPDYTKARRCAFLTVKPSKRARKLMKELTYQD
jgi:hypothetical protein